MATTKAVPHVGPQYVRVHIGLDAHGNISVDPDPFWIYRSENEQVKWICVRHHEHGSAGDPCFTVNFKQSTGSPFQDSQFAGDGVTSGPPRHDADDNFEYQYSITMGDKKMDPGGGVRP